MPSISASAQHAQGECWIMLAHLRPADGAPHIDAILALDALRARLLWRDVLAVLQQRLQAASVSTSQQLVPASAELFLVQFRQGLGLCR